MKTGLVLEGGAMRGMFTAGVLDVLMEHGIVLDGAIGVSAGAVFGCNYKSHQIGRVIRYNTQYCNDKRYASFGNLLRTGNLYSEQFCYHTVPEKLDVFDAKAFAENPMDFLWCAPMCVPATPSITSAAPAMPRISSGCRHPLPCRWRQDRKDRPLSAAGRRHCRFHPRAVLRVHRLQTQPHCADPAQGLCEKKNKMLPVIRARYLRYPAFVEAVADRHERYNETLDHIAMLEQTGKAFVIRPPIPLEIGSMERDPVQLRRVYETGRAVAEIQVDKIAAFVNESKAAAEE